VKVHCRFHAFSLDAKLYEPEVFFISFRGWMGGLDVPMFLYLCKGAQPLKEFRHEFTPNQAHHKSCI
jgi:hypothetical protein